MMKMMKTIKMMKTMKTMKKLLTIGICLLAFQTAALAETMYVNDTIRITVRTGPGINFKVLAEAESGQAMDVQEVKEGWSRVILPDGRTGWVLARFLTRSEPKEIQLRIMKKSNEELSVQIDTLMQEIARLEEDRRKTDLLSGDHRRALDEMARAYDNLKTESKDFLKMKAAYENASRDVAREKKTVNEMNARMEDLEWRRNAVFFIGGGAMVIIGFLIGILNRAGTRRKTSLR